MAWLVIVAGMMTAHPSNMMQHACLKALQAKGCKADMQIQFPLVRPSDRSTARLRPRNTDQAEG
jgi:hypothetical protein